jgi:hypothetical protein
LSPKLRKHIPAKHLRRESGAAAGFPKPAPGCPFFSEQRLPATGQTTSYVAGDDGETRAGAPLRYRDNGDGTITDKNTKLMWEKKDQASGGLHNWNNTYPWGTCSNNASRSGCREHRAREITGGTDGSRTLCWREWDSNHRSPRIRHSMFNPTPGRPGF